jgi:phosphoribosyl 1,2-cyclic phosphodiesterase
MIFLPISSSSAGNLYLVRDTHADRTLAIECGIRFVEMQRKLKHRVCELDAVLLSHEHKDHSRSLKDVLKSGVDTYALEETFEALRVNGNHNAHAVDPLTAFIVKKHWQILPFDTRHDVPSLGFLIVSGKEKLLYVTDTAYVPYRFQGLTQIAIEANYSEEILRESEENSTRKLRSLKYHLSIERLIDPDPEYGFFAANDLNSVREINLIHLSDAHSDEALFKRLVEEATGKPVFVAEGRI